MNIPHINAVMYDLENSQPLGVAADEVLDILQGVQYKQAKVILKMALNRLDTRAKIT